MKSQCKFEKQIRTDMVRSYRRHSVFQQDDSLAHQSLYNVLSTYSIYRPQLGYNQAQSFICAFLLMYLEEEDCFWTLHQLVTDKKYSMEGMWSDGMPLVLLRFAQFSHVLSKHEPEIAERFDKFFISPGMYRATQWFVSIFLATDLKFNLLLRIWDIYLNEGTKFVFRIGIALLQSCKNDILNAEEETQILERLQRMTSEQTEELIPAALKIPLTHSQLYEIENDHFVE